MKMTFKRLVAFAAGLLVATSAIVRADCESIVWDNWTAGVNDQYGWPSELYANDPYGDPDDSVGVLDASGGGIYGAFYYTFFDSVNFSLTPGSVQTGVKKILLRVNRTYNPTTHGPKNVLLYINGGGTGIAPTLIVDNAGPNGDDYIILWDFCDSKVPPAITSFEIEWNMVPHSTFDELILTQCDDCEDEPDGEL